MAKKPALESEVRRFQIDPHAIMSLIKAQAGSIEKAMLEAVANSMDAGATRIDVTLDNKRIVIKDNGSGLGSKEDIYKFFEVFGFDHSQLGRTVGRFGVGRGQLFCFGVNTWRTNTFQMAIDIKNKGMDYDLATGLKKVEGMTITIDLNDPLLASEALHIEEEFRKLVRYCTVPVFYNGRQISEDPAEASWTEQTEQAWFQLRKSGPVDVYSQGLFVRQVYGYGIGGRVVTKTGFPLEQNLARNDILVKECAVWKKVDATIKAAAKKLMDKASVQQDLTPHMRKVKAKDAMTVEGVGVLMVEKLFTLSNSKHVSLKRLIETGLVSVAERADHRADKFMQRKQAMILEEETLERFGVDSVTELFQRLEANLRDSFEKLGPCQRVVGGNKPIHSYQVEEMAKALKRCKVFDHLEDLPLDHSMEYTEVAFSKLSDEEKAVGNALMKQMRPIGYIVARHRQPDVDPHDLQVRERKLKFVEDNGMAAAFTDGMTTVWMNRKIMMAMARKGSAGFMELIGLLVHEHLHDQSSRAAHAHQPEFYEDFHNVLLFGNVSHYALSAFALSVKHSFKPQSRQLSSLEKAGVIIDVPVGVGLVEDGEVEQDVEPVSVPRRRARVVR